MTNITARDYTTWIGSQVVDQGGNKVGKVSQIYANDQTGEPEWLTINTGMFSNRSSFVPLQGARADGDKLVISHEKNRVKGAPQVDDDGDGYLQPEEERELYRYYGQEYETGQVVTGRETGSDTSGYDTSGYDTSGPETDDAMTRSEEQVRVGTARQESGRARLRKYVVTEDVQTTVPVSHEEVRVEREPITAANRGAAMSGGNLTEEEHEVVLNEERPVVQKEVVPKERVRMGKETVTEQQTVSEQVRKEQIETEGTQTGRRGR